MNIDEDFVPLSLIAACIIIWITSVFAGGNSPSIAADVVQSGLAAVAGYMSRNKLASKVEQLEKENELLRSDLSNSLIDYDQN
jgi:hypothetical protein